MALTVTHPYVSTVAEAPGSGTPGGLVGPTEWNAAHNVSGNLPVTQLNSGTNATATTFWRGDGTWAAASSTTTFNVLSYGATGNGVTDDTASINSAIAAFNSAGRGALYFPAGTYLCSAALTTITANGIIFGDGPTNLWGQGLGGSPSASTQINCSSASANLFTVNGSQELLFRDLSITNTSGNGATGSGITATHATSYGIKVDYHNIQVSNFNINIDVQVGSQWTMFNCAIVNPTTYGVKVRNTVLADAGDWQITNCWFYPATQNATSALRCESSGGGKIVGNKFNASASSTHTFATGIDIQGGAGTSDLSLCGNSIENQSSTGMLVNGSWPNVAITGNQFAFNGTQNISLQNASTVTICGNVLGSASTASIVLSGCSNINVGNNVNLSTTYVSGTPNTDGSGGIGGGQFFAWDGGSNLTWTSATANSAVLNTKATSSTQEAAVTCINNVSGNNASMQMLGSGLGGERAGKGQFGSSTAMLVVSDASQATGGSDPISFRAGGFQSSQEVFQARSAGNLAMTNSANFSGNGSVATVLGSIGPAGSHTTVQKWLTITDGSNTLYIPCF